MKESPEDIIERFEERRREARAPRVKLIFLAFGDLVLAVVASLLVFYFFYDTVFFPILFPAVSISLPTWIGHRWARRLPFVASKKKPDQPPQTTRAFGPRV